MNARLLLSEGRNLLPWGPREERSQEVQLRFDAAVQSELRLDTDTSLRVNDCAPLLEDEDYEHTGIGNDDSECVSISLRNREDSMCDETGPAHDGELGFGSDNEEFSDDGAEFILDASLGHEGSSFFEYSSSDGEGEDAGLSPEPSSRFSSWALQCRQWIDLFFKHGFSQAAIDDTLSLINSPYKTWKTVYSHLRRDSGMEETVKSFTVCAGHMCFFSESVQNCSVCGCSKTGIDSARKLQMGWMTLRPRLQSWFLEKVKCEQLYSYLESLNPGLDGATRDFFDTDSFRRICNLYGGEEFVQDDIFLAVSTDGFQAFKSKTHDVWPIVAIVCNLPPHLRFNVKNVVPFAFIPGPSEPVDLQSFLEPLVMELEEINADGGSKFQFYDSVERKIRVHVLWFTGDLPAIKKISGIKGHNGKLPCRFCTLTGVWSPAHRHNYYPLKVRNERGLETRYDVQNLPLRTIPDSNETIALLTYLSGPRKEELQLKTGISEGSNLFRIANIVPYSSFPIDIMHLFYNIGRDMLRLWCSDNGDTYVLGRNAMRVIDSELREFGVGVASQLGARPRPITRFKNWKSAEVKDFILRYSLVVLDGYLPQHYLTGWALFVDLVDLCWRPVLTEADIKEVGRLSSAFYAHYERDYYRYDIARMNLCKYVFHLVLHIEAGIRESGPPVGYSQYWMERYIGWVVGRLKARNLAAASLFKSALFGESYKMFYDAPFASDTSHYDEVRREGGFQMWGKAQRLQLSPNSDDGSRMFGRLRSYMVRKYDGMTAQEADELLHGIDSCTVRPRLRFLSGSDIQTASSYLELRHWSGRGSRSRVRASCHVACEMESGQGCDVYYGRILKLLEFEVQGDLSNRWAHWQSHYEVALMDWMSGMELSTTSQVYKNCNAEDAFRGATVEDVCIVRRLISVVNHVVPTVRQQETSDRSRSTTRRGRKRCYFIDDCLRSDRLLDLTNYSVDGVNRVLCGVHISRRS